MGDLVGRTLGTYRLEVLIGRGTLGDVYRGAHVFRAQRAAIKVIDPTLTSLPGFDARFRTTLSTIAPLVHAHLVRLLQFDTQEQSFFIVSELMTSGSLEEVLRRSSGTTPLSVDSALDLGRQAIAGTAHAHAAGLVHGNIKPANLLLDQQAHGTGSSTKRASGDRYVLKVADLGLSQLAGPSGALTSVGITLGTGVMGGTPLYMSPEQCRGHRLDQRSDVYALGLVLYELVTGIPPFQVTSLTEAIRAHIQLSPPDPRRVNPEIPPAVEQIIVRCLAKDPADRFQTAAEIAAALEAAVPVS